MASENPSTSARRDFDATSLQELRKLGLSNAQVFRLRRALPEIALAIQGPSRMDEVRTELKSIEAGVKAVLKTLDRAVGARTRSVRTPTTEALGHIGIAAAYLDKHAATAHLGDVDGAIPDRIDLSVLMTLAVAVVGDAISRQAPSRQRLKHSKAPAVVLVVDALMPRAGVDLDAEQDSPMTKVSRTPGAPFLRVCELVFVAASGTSAGAETAIRAFISQQKGG